MADAGRKIEGDKGDLASVETLKSACVEALFLNGGLNGKALALDNLSDVFRVQEIKPEMKETQKVNDKILDGI